MRGIGTGQTIHLYMIPEVKALVETHNAKGRGETRKTYVERMCTLTPQELHRQWLVDVATWLVINSMHSEKMQFNLLCEHSVRNVWRKQCFKTLMANADRLGTAKTEPFDRACLNNMRDRIMFTVENAVPEYK